MQAQFSLSFMLRVQRGDGWVERRKEEVAHSYVLPGQLTTQPGIWAATAAAAREHLSTLM